MYVVYDNYGATAHSIITSNLYELATRLTINDEYDSFKEWFDEYFEGFPLLNSGYDLEEAVSSKSIKPIILVMIPDVTYWYIEKHGRDGLYIDPIIILIPQS